MMITQEMVLSWRPYYSDEKVAETFRRSGLTEWTPLDVLDLNIPAQDRLCVVLREEVLGDRVFRLCACDFAERVIPLYEAVPPEDHRLWRAIEMSRRYAVGEAAAEEIDEVAWSARVPARVAARAAAAAVAEAVSSAVAAEAASAAAAAAAAVAAAAWASASSASAAAAEAAARVAERDAQIEIVRSYLL